ncbi:hypothetical protein DL96DRAFT_974856 [Flagelloscypha sp. PMI_526]|nr:hypothetical protein DL96DRAFT_974856 [Flagelloscypha sp. PMI_526]
MESPSLENQGSISMSTTFFPNAEHFQLPPDTALRTSDAVYFYVHSYRLLELSTNQFGSALSSRSPLGHTSEGTPLVDIPLPSPVLNLILHAIYDLSCAQYGPNLDMLRESVHTMEGLGISPKRLILPNSPLFALFMAFAPTQPMDVYMIASKYDLHDLAVSSSSHLLSYPLSSITDSMAAQLGPVYLKRLFFLHMGRSDALKRILLEPPQVHGPTSSCDFTDQKAVTRAWCLASAYLAFEVRPDMSTGFIESTFRPLMEHITCPKCMDLLDERIQTLLANWSRIKRTI